MSEDTADRLAALRTEGIVPYSPCSTACAVAAAVVTAVWIERDQAAGLIRAVFELSLGAGEVHTPERLHAIGRDAVSVFATPLIAGAVAAMVWGLSQTRWYLGFHRVIPDVARLGGRDAAGSGQGIWRMTVLTALPALVLAVFGVAAWCWWVVWPRLWRIPRLAPERLGAEAEALIGAIVVSSCAVLVVIAVSMWLLGRLSFVIRHRARPDGGG